MVKIPPVTVQVVQGPQQALLVVRLRVELLPEGQPGILAVKVPPQQPVTVKLVLPTLPSIETMLPAREIVLQQGEQVLQAP